MSLSELQRARLLHLFDAYDATRDGQLERADYERVAHAVACERGHPIGSAEHEAIARRFLTQLARFADIGDFSRDGKIGPDEWLDFFDIVLEDARAFESVVGATVDLVLEVFDLDGDRTIDRVELARVRRALSLDAGDSDQVFDALDADGDGRLCAGELRAAIERYFRGEDGGAAGFFGLVGV